MQTVRIVMETLAQSYLKKQSMIKNCLKIIILCAVFEGHKGPYTHDLQYGRRVMGVLKVTSCLRICLFVINRSIVHFANGVGRKSQIWPLFVDARNACPLRLKLTICYLCQIYISMEKDISAMFLLINHVRFNLLTLRSSLFH